MSQYENHNLENEELPFIYRERVVVPTGLVFGASNWHENIEILYVVRGEGRISNNGQLISAAAGDITVINSNHLHGLAAGECEMVHRYLIVDRSFCIANGIDTSAVHFESCISDGRVRELLEEIHAEYSKPTDTAYRTAKIRSLVLALVVLLCERHSAPVQSTERPERSAAYVKRAIAYIRASYARNFSLEETADFVGVNKCYLSREFKKYTGYSFVEYVNRTRCKMAERLLSEGETSVSEAGRRAGFENRSYFARTFERYSGVLPSEYRARAKG